MIFDVSIEDIVLWMALAGIVGIIVAMLILRPMMFDHERFVFELTGWFMWLAVIAIAAGVLLWWIL